MKISNRLKRTALLTSLALSASFATQAADKPVELRFAHWVPAQHALARLGIIPWGKSIEEASGGTIKVSIFPAQQLGKAPDHYDMVRDGIADMAFVNPGYQAGRFPIFAAAELPFMFQKPGPASAAVDRWYAKYETTEMKDVKVCLAHLHIGTIHSKKPITSPDQIRGMKIRAANGTVAQMVNVLGGSTVQVSAPESRDALSKGIADAITFPWESILSFKIDKVTTYHTDMRLYAAAFVWPMNKAWYDKLSASQKKVMDDHCNNEWAAKIGADWGDYEDAGQKKFAAMSDHTIVPLTADQLNAWKTATRPVYDQWEASMKKIGLDGKQVLSGLKE